jgi:hypothetical protein
MKAMRAIMVGPLFSTTRSRASTADRQDRRLHSFALAMAVLGGKRNLTFECADFPKAEIHHTRRRQENDGRRTVGAMKCPIACGIAALSDLRHFGCDCELFHVAAVKSGIGYWLWNQRV